MFVALAEEGEGLSVVEAEAHGIEEVGKGCVEETVAVAGEVDPDLLEEGVATLAGGEELSGRRGEGNVKGSKRREAMAKEVEGEGLQDVGGVVAGVEGGGEVCLYDGGAGEGGGEGGGRGRGASGGAELGTLDEVAVGLGREVTAAAKACKGRWE